MRSKALDHLTKPVEHDLRRLGTLIREARANRGFTQADLAARLRISPTTVRAAEQGDPSVAAGIVISLLWILGLGPVSANLATEEAKLEQAGAHRKRVRPAKAPDDF
jgi:transcriptional regulator with XRE-family HTH domain